MLRERIARRRRFLAWLLYAANAAEECGDEEGAGRYRRIAEGELDLLIRDKNYASREGVTIAA